MASVRYDFEQLLVADLAEVDELADAKVIATERELDAITGPTILIRQQGIHKFPPAPMSHRAYQFLMTVISGHEDLDRAQDELDEMVNAILNYLDIRFQYGDATAVGYGGRLAYDIPVTVLAMKN